MQLWQKRYNVCAAVPSRLWWFTHNKRIFSLTLLLCYILNWSVNNTEHLLAVSKQVLLQLCFSCFQPAGILVFGKWEQFGRNSRFCLWTGRLTFCQMTWYCLTWTVGLVYCVLIWTNSGLVKKNIKQLRFYLWLWDRKHISWSVWITAQQANTINPLRANLIHSNWGFLCWGSDMEPMFSLREFFPTWFTWHNLLFVSSTGGSYIPSSRLVLKKK